MCIGRRGKEHPTARAVSHPPVGSSVVSHHLQPTEQLRCSGNSCQALNSPSSFILLKTSVLLAYRVHCTGGGRVGSPRCRRRWVSRAVLYPPGGLPQGGLEELLSGQCPSPPALGSHTAAGGGSEAEAWPKRCPGTGRKPAQGTGREPGWAKCTGARCESLNPILRRSHSH